MSPPNAKPLLAGVHADGFVGRQAEIERLYAAAVAGLPAKGLRVSAAPGVGTSELLRQVFDRLFFEQRFCLPFYFALSPADRAAAGAATRYLYQFLLQAVAFRRGEPEIIATQPEICDLVKLAPPGDAEWVDDIKDICQRNGPLHDNPAFLRTALTAPLKAISNGIRVFPMIDQLHASVEIENGRQFVDVLESVFPGAREPFVLAARRGFSVRGDQYDSLTLTPLDREEAAELIGSRAAEADVEISDRARDLIAVQTGGRPAAAQLLIDAARAEDKQLESFRDVEQVYAEELVGGRIGGQLDERLQEIVPDAGVRRRLIEAFYFALEPGTSRFPLDALRERLGVESDEFARITELLAIEGYFTLEGGVARIEEDTIHNDFVDSRYQLGKTRTTAAAVRAHIVTKAIGRAPRLMERVYRSAAAVGLRDLLLSFDLQEVSNAALDYRAFRDKYKGLSDDEILSRMRDDRGFALPQISHAASLVEHVVTAAEYADPERVVLAVGFSDREYRPEDRVAWLAAELDSKLEAEYELAQTWIDRLEAAAIKAGYDRYRIWLIAPEGFTNDALDLLEEHGGIGSGRRQAGLLKSILSPENRAEASNLKEYEMVIPIGDDAELISAHSIEEIARRHDFPAKAVNQIKTALVEACINASEHGMSPDRRIYQKFAVDDEKIVITISNRGVRMRPRSESSAAEEPAVERGGRRGWGLELIRRLMDEVRVEQVDDGTRILMTKYLREGGATA